MHGIIDINMRVHYREDPRGTHGKSAADLQWVINIGTTRGSTINNQRQFMVVTI